MTEADGTDSQEEGAWYIKDYKCPCGTTWQDEWDCLCDDRCPSCDTACEVLSYEEIDRIHERPSEPKAKETDRSDQAYAAGYKAAREAGPRAPALNPTMQTMLDDGRQVGEGDTIAICKAFHKGYQAWCDQEADRMLHGERQA